MRDDPHPQLIALMVAVAVIAALMFFGLLSGLFLPVLRLSG